MRRPVPRSVPRSECSAAGARGQVPGCARPPERRSRIWRASAHPAGRAHRSPPPRRRPCESPSPRRHRRCMRADRCRGRRAPRHRDARSGPAAAGSANTDSTLAPNPCGAASAPGIRPKSLPGAISKMLRSGCGLPSALKLRHRGPDGGDAAIIVERGPYLLRAVEGNAALRSRPPSHPLSPAVRVL